MSVSRVVNGTRRVSPEVERRVRQAIEKIGYVPNEAARILKGNRSSVIGLIVPDLADPFFAELGHAVQQTAWNAGFMTLMAASGHREELERRETELMVQHRVAGLLAVAMGTKNTHFAEAQRAGVPIVAIDRPIKNVTSDVLTVNNLAASIGATQHLLDHGHRRVLCVADTEHIHTKQQRVAGYKKAMRRAGLEPIVCLVGPGGQTMTGTLNEALTGSKCATAIFAESNLVATAILQELQARVLKVPDDVALICFDDFSAAMLVSPKVSVVQQPVAELGRQAAGMLLRRLQGASPNLDGAQHVQLETTLVIRESCGPHAKNGDPMRSDSLSRSAAMR